jgi:hypothetical protein
MSISEEMQEKVDEIANLFDDEINDYHRYQPAVGALVAAIEKLEAENYELKAVVDELKTSMYFSSAFDSDAALGKLVRSRSGHILSALNFWLIEDDCSTTREERQTRLLFEEALKDGN